MKFTHQIKSGCRRGLFALLSAGLLFSLPAAAWAEVDHRIFAELLTRYNSGGQVDYAGLKREESRLDAYVESLSEIDPDALSPDERFAFYVNMYNAWTIKLILSGYPCVEV